MRDTSLVGLLREHTARGQFILSSGQTTDWYVDCRQVTYSENGPKLARAVYGLIREVEDEIKVRPTALGGVGYGGIPLALFSAVHLMIPSFFVRPLAKSHGKKGRIGGPLQPHAKTVLVDDVVSTGAALTSGVRAVREVGAEVLYAICLVNRNKVELDVPLLSLIDPEQLLEAG